MRYWWRYSALLFHEASAASMPSRAPNMWVNLIWQTPKCRCVWFVYVGAPSLPFRSVIFRLCMLLSAAFMSPLIPSCCTGAALNCHAGCSMYKTHTHRPQVPPLHPQPPLMEINNLRASKTHTHTHMCSLTWQTLLFLSFVFSEKSYAGTWTSEHLSRGRFHVDLVGLRPQASSLRGSTPAFKKQWNFWNTMNSFQWKSHNQCWFAD